MCDGGLQEVVDRWMGRLKVGVGSYRLIFESERGARSRVECANEWNTVE